MNCKNCNSELIKKSYLNKKNLNVVSYVCEKCNFDKSKEKYNKYANENLNFGKYRDNKIIDIVKNDPEYVEYLINKNNIDKNFKKNGNFLRLLYVKNHYNENNNI